MKRKVPAAATGCARASIVIGVAAIPAVLYLLYVFEYSVNVPYADDWSFIPLVDSALHGHLSMSEVWTQYGDTRVVLPKLIFVAFAYIDHLNIRSILLFSAVLFIASYGLLLALLRIYLTKRLTVLPVLVVGIVWFSLEDVQNSLWSFQLAWYLTPFLFVAMIYFLLVPRQYQTVFLGLGIVAAVGASYSLIQGFALWPVGLICILWNTPWERRVYFRAATWISAAVASVAIYVRGYNTSNAACFPHTRKCALSFGLSHPFLLLRYFVVLVGNVVPEPWKDLNIVVPEVLGTAISVAAVLVVVSQFRERRLLVVPLPCSLILFGVCFDLMIAVGRVGEGLPAALQYRFTMPNLILLVGIVIYACARLPTLRRVHRPIDWNGRLRILAFVTLGVFLVVQFMVATEFGIANGRATRQTYETDARIVVNLHRIPTVEQGCDVAFAVLPEVSPPSVALTELEVYRLDLERNHLSVFQPTARRLYRAEGPPTKIEIDKAGDYASVRGPRTPSCH